MNSIDPGHSATLRLSTLKEASVRLEAQFLSEMLKASGLDAQTAEFAGGVGESQFASFLRDAQAEEIARSGGGIGLAESLFEALKARDGNAH